MPAKAATFDHLHADELMYLVEDEVKARLASLDQTLVEHRYDKSVRNLIAYHLRYPEQTARNIGRAVAFFPWFEQELKAAGLPIALKYLPIIESALRPDALSRVGARGLWQFMPATAREYGLRIDTFVDERMDLVKSTRAAIAYLQRAYTYTDDWSMAIAAYNCGPGGARRAQRRSGRKTFWGARRFLPRETRAYLPAFIAAVYLSEFYQAHKIKPHFPGLDEQLLEVVHITQAISFYRLAQITGLSIDLIERYNPQFIQGYVPAYTGGHYLFLPSRVVPALREYLQLFGDYLEEPALPWVVHPLQLPVYQAQDQTHYQEFIWPVVEGDSLRGIAELTGIPLSRISLWNGLSPRDSLLAGQEIHYYRPRSYLTLPKRKVEVVDQALHSVPLPTELASSGTLVRALPDSKLTQIRYYLSRPMRVAEIRHLFPGFYTTETRNWKSKLGLERLPAGTEFTIAKQLR